MGRFRHITHLVKVSMRSQFGFKYQFSSPQTWLKVSRGFIKRYKYSVITNTPGNCPEVPYIKLGLEK